MESDYTVVDMCFWSWAKVISFVLDADGWEKLPHVKLLLDEFNARTAAQRAEVCKTKFTFKTDVNGDARKMLLPLNEHLKQTGA